jgi:hypothetical protein
MPQRFWMGFLCGVLGCAPVEQTTRYPETRDLCATHPQFCEPCGEQCPCGGFVEVCCTEQGCVKWGGRPEGIGYLHPSDPGECQGTLGLCRNGIGGAGADGFNPVACFFLI